MLMATYSVLIIGAGKIGAFFDAPESEHVLTHAHAFSRHQSFILAGFVDSDYEQAKLAAHVWNCEAYTSISAAFERGDIDIAVVATPDSSHYSILKELACFPVRLVLAEKPLTTSLIESQEIIQLYRTCEITLAMNYTRRYVPEFFDLKSKIASGEFGKFLVGTGYYGKGTLHNGSHMIDLLRFMLGEISQTRTLSSTYDYYEYDPSCTAELAMACGGQFVMQAVDCRCHTIFEFDLVFESRRVRIVDSGFTMEMYSVKGSEFFSGYRNLSLLETESTSLGNALLFAAQNIYEHLASGAPVPSSGMDGFIAQQLCRAIVDGSP